MWLWDIPHSISRCKPTLRIQQQGLALMTPTQHRWWQAPQWTTLESSQTAHRQENKIHQRRQRDWTTDHTTVLQLSLATLRCWQHTYTVSDVGTLPRVPIAKALKRRQSIWSSSAHTRPGSEGDVARPQNISRSATPVELPGVNWGGHLPRRPGMGKREECLLSFDDTYQQKTILRLTSDRNNYWH